MRKRVLLQSAVLLVAAVNLSDVAASCLPPAKGQTPLDVLECLHSELDSQQKRIAEIKELRQQNKTLQGQITELQTALSSLRDEIHAEKPYYFTGALATPTEWMADVIFNDNYKRFCEAIGKTYVKAETLQNHYQSGRENGWFYKGWYYTGTRFCDSDTHVWSAEGATSSPDNPYNVWKYSGKCGCCIHHENRWTFEKSAIIWCK
jgi:hypothetical protein